MITRHPQPFYGVHAVGGTTSASLPLAQRHPRLLRRACRVADRYPVALRLPTVGNLLGTRAVLNEFVAYTRARQARRSWRHLTPRTLAIATFALCGFANLGSVGMQIGGIGALVPEPPHRSR
jgi:hypothetical protein